MEDPASFYDSYGLHSYYFGPNNTLYLGDVNTQDDSNDAEDEAEDEDLSLNSLSNPSSPVKFLKKPIFDLNSSFGPRRGLTPVYHDMSGHTPVYRDISPSPVPGCHPCPNCVKGTCRLKRHQLGNVSSTSSSCYSGSPIFRVKTSTPEQQGEDDQILQRTVAYNRLTFRHHAPGHDIRMRGDGCDDDISGHYGHVFGLSRDTSLSSLAEMSQGSVSVSNSMMDIVRDARSVLHRTCLTF